MYQIDALHETDVTGYPFKSSTRSPRNHWPRLAPCFDMRVMYAFVLICPKSFPHRAYGCNRLGSRGNNEALLILFNFKNNMMTRSKPVTSAYALISGMSD
jgi:hypothetical protein